MKKLLSICLAALLVLSLAGCGKTSVVGITTTSKAPAANEESQGVGTHHAEIEIQDYGTITVELDGDAAPITVQNFMDLANDGFYDGLTFHRIIPGFMIQGGDPKGNGTGSTTPVKGEMTANGFENNLTHIRGVLSIARRGRDYNSGSCQFFICNADAPHLNGEYASFGYVVAGMETVDSISAVATNAANNAPTESVVMEKVCFVKQK